MGFYFADKDTRKRERITIRLDLDLLGRLMAEPGSLSETIRRILRTNFEKQDDHSGLSQ